MQIKCLHSFIILQLFIKFKYMNEKFAVMILGIQCLNQVYVVRLLLVSQLPENDKETPY